MEQPFTVRLVCVVKNRKCTRVEEVPARDADHAFKRVLDLPGIDCLAVDTMEIVTKGSIA